MIAPVRDSMRAEGVTLGTSILFVVFFLTSLRFFIGAQFHLIDESLLKMRGDVWFYDFFVIVLEMVALIFLGGVISVESNRNSQVGFIEFLILLLAIDVFWVVSQWVMGRLTAAWRRSKVPWAWAILNLATIVLLGAILVLAPEPYATVPLMWMGAFAVVAFIVDVLLIDYYDVI
jgi:hypothetical protein